MTRVLVVAASKHGSTYDIATRIAHRLRAMNLHVVVSPPERVTDLDHYDAAVIGSAIYAGHWMQRARRFVDDSVDELSGIPVWFFSSGPLGSTDGSSQGELDDVDGLVETTHARDHHIFAGHLEHDGLGALEKIVVRAVGAPCGDFRNWLEVDQWAEAVGADVKRLVAVG